MSTCSGKQVTIFGGLIPFSHKPMLCKPRSRLGGNNTRRISLFLVSEKERNEAVISAKRCFVLIKRVQRRLALVVNEPNVFDGKCNDPFVYHSKTPVLSPDPLVCRRTCGISTFRVKIDGQIRPAIASYLVPRTWNRLQGGTLHG